MWFKPLVLLILMSRACMATTFTTTTASPPTTRSVQVAIPPAIYAAIRQIRPDGVLDPDFSHSYERTVGASRIRVTLTYCTLCLDRAGIPNQPILGQDFINRCNLIFAQMLSEYSQPGRGGSGFQLGGIRGVDQGIRLEFRVFLIHDELIAVSHRPSPGFVSPPPVADLSKVQLIDNGSLRLHGQPRNGSFRQVVDYYDANDCIIEDTYLVGDAWTNGEELPSNEYLQSPGQQFHLVMQVDCNLVLYDSNNNYVHFATGTDGKGRNCYTLMQPDCNLVVYDGNHTPMWASNTAYAPSDRIDCLLAVEDSGVIQIWMTTFAEDYQSWSTDPLWEAGAVAIS